MSKRITRTPSRRRKLQKSVLLLVEGSTERNIIPHCFDKRDYPDLSITIHDYNGGGYMEIEHWISRRRDTLDIVLVVCDLDRAASSKDEEKALRKTIAAAWFRNKPLYYKKVDFSQGQFDENHLTTSQSALYYLEDYLQLLNDK